LIEIKSYRIHQGRLHPSGAASRGHPHGWIRALAARRAIDMVGLRLAPAVTASLVIWSHCSLGQGAVAFAAVLAAGQLLERSPFPLSLLPAARIALALAAPLFGLGAAVAIMVALETSLNFGDFVAALVAAWLVLALGAWIRLRVDEVASARIAVIGDRSFAQDLAHEFDEARVHDHRLAGWIGKPGDAGDGLVWLGSLREVRRIVLEQDIELLVVAPGADLSEVEERAVFETVADFCLDLPVKMIAANQLYEQLLGHVPIGTIDAAWFRYIMHPAFHTTSPTSKRVFDVVGSVLISMLFAPVLIAVAMAVKLADGGPVLYRQRRVGEHGREFEMLKFRTMGTNAEADGGARWSTGDDPRVTRVGRLLRRTHIDELAQLWNVIRGEMTLVGPRPERPELMGKIESQFPHYNRRHLVKPGIAGWAKLRCGYAGTEEGAAWTLCHDLYYVKHRSLLGDALILFETAFETFRDPHRWLRSPSKRFLFGRQLSEGPNG
jgi:exopolysaccharide biosynthesis polyprenyl glycosylphosphotransferase